MLVSDETYYLEKVLNLSQHASLLWGKTDPEDKDIWLPLHVHLSDTVAIAELMWDRWVPMSTKQVIARSVTESNSEYQSQDPICDAKKIFLACASVHDIGKATPAFQIKAEFNNKQVLSYIKESGLAFRSMVEPEKTKHALASQAIMEGYGWDPSLTITFSGHHGKPPSLGQVMSISRKDRNMGFDDEAWLNVQTELTAFALGLIGLKSEDPLFKLKLKTTSQVALTGLIIIADWLASDQNSFTYLHIPISMSQLESPLQRSERSWLDLKWPSPWQPIAKTWSTELFEEQFTFAPRPVQEAIFKELSKADKPGLVIIEAAMGEGKTEAALAAAEILAEKTGSSGLFFALPTQATSNSMFPRIVRWMDSLKQPNANSVFLAHGKAQFIKDDEHQSLIRPSQIGIDSEENEQQTAAIINDWFQGRKKGVLANFVVGTIDQVLMGGLKQRHLALRHIALVNKVVVIDECHAYDAYMSSYLYKVVKWLGAYNVPTVVLSATLPNSKRELLINSYLGKDSRRSKAALPWLGIDEANEPEPNRANTKAYPLITYTDGEAEHQSLPNKSSRTLEVSIHRIDDESFIPILETLLPEGGCVGVIANTVARAQSLAELCRDHFGSENVVLHHAQFIAEDRINREKDLLEQLGSPADNPHRPRLMITVGTQVFEQSLDIDFDVLFTDVCPMDLLIQRIGRMHRHAGRIRPTAFDAAHCYVMGILGDGQYENGSESVYGKYLLMNTDLLLPETMSLPDDISGLVQKAYADEGLDVEGPTAGQYRKAKDEFDQSINDQQVKALSYQISSPFEGSETLVGWLDADVDDDSSGKRGEATVRNAGESIEVLVVQQLANGILRLLPWVEPDGGTVLPTDYAPPSPLAKSVSRCSVRLPSRLCMPWNIDKTIAELEQTYIDRLPECWQESKWLNGELFLVLDEDYNTVLADQTLHYSYDNGLSIERRQDGSN